MGSSPALATCETSQVLLAGVSGGFSQGSPVFAPPTDWPVSFERDVKKNLKYLYTSFSALDLQPDDALVLKRRADVRGKLGLKDKAIRDYKQAIELQARAQFLAKLKKNPQQT